MLPTDLWSNVYAYSFNNYLLPPHSAPGSLHPVFGLENMSPEMHVEGGEAPRNWTPVLVLPLLSGVTTRQAT